MLHFLIGRLLSLFPTVSSIVLMGLLAVASTASRAQESTWLDVSESFEIVLSNPVRNRRTQEATVFLTVTNSADAVFQPLRLRIKGLTPGSLGLREAVVDQDGALVIGMGQGFGAGETRQLTLTFHNDAAPAAIDFEPRIERYGDAPPRVISVTPDNGSQAVRVDTPIVLTFSEALATESITQDNFLLWSGGQIIRPNVSARVGNREITLRAMLPDNSTVAVIVLDGVRDRMGTPMETWFLSLLGTTNAAVDSPRIIAQLIEGNDPSPTAEPPPFVQLAADRAIDRTTLDGNVTVAFTFSPSAEPIAGRLELVGDDDVIQFTPDEPFPPFTPLFVRMSSGVTDTEGNAFPDELWSDVTPAGKSRVRLPPRPWVYDPDTTDPVKSLNVLPMVRYNQHLDPATVNSSTVQLYAVEASGLEAQVPVDVVLEDSILIKLLPAAPLMPGTQYRIALAADITDIDAERQGYDTGLFFTLADDAVVDTRQPQVMHINPPNGSEGLATRSRLQVIFDEPISQATFPWRDANTFGFTADSRQIVYRPVPLIMPSNSEISSAVPSVFDLAGNALVPFTTTFTTGDSWTGGVARRLAFSPTGDRVPLNATLTVLYDKPIDPLSLDLMFVSARFQGNSVDVDVSQSPAGNIVYFVPRKPLEPGGFYGLVNSPRDLESGEVVPGGFSFRAGFEQDVTPPTIALINLEDGEDGVPNNVRLRVRFDEPLDMTDLIAQNRITLRAGDGESVPFNVAFDADRRGVLLTPINLLAANEDYELSVARVLDRAGNQSSESRTVRFTAAATVDVVPPLLIARSPPAGAQAVPTNAVAQFLSNERLDPVSLQFARGSLDTLSFESSPPEQIDRLLSDDGKRVTVSSSRTMNPAQPWGFSRISDLTDLAGNVINQDSARFSIGLSPDNTPPRLLLSTPPPGATGVPINGRIALSFDDGLSPVCLAGAFSLNGHPITDVVVSGEREVEIRPDELLLPSTRYDLEVEGVCNYAGLEMPTVSLSFTTGASAAADTAAPEVVNITPAEGAAGVAPDEPVVIEFSETVDPLSLVHLQVLVDAGPVAGEFLADGSVVTFTPELGLPPFSRITVRNAGVADLAGNASVETSYAFDSSTGLDETPPTVETVYPADGAEDVPRRAGPLTLGFSEPMDVRTLNSDNLLLWVDGEIVRPAVSHSPDNRTVFLDAAYPQSAQIVIIALTGLKDLSGNALSRPYLSTFFSETPPTFSTPFVFNEGLWPVEIFPSRSGSSEFDRLMLIFNTPLDPATVENGLVVVREIAFFELPQFAGDLEIVEGEFLLTAQNKALTFIPETPFADGETIRLYLGESLLSSAGDPLRLQRLTGGPGISVVPVERFDFTRKINLQSSTPFLFPRLIRSNPGDRDKDVPINAVLEMQFGDFLDPATVNTTNIQLFEGLPGGQIEVPVDVAADGRNVRVHPVSPLTPGEDYQIRVTGCCQGDGLKDLDGEQDIFGASVRFTTAPSGQPDTERPYVVYASPFDGAVEVPRNARIAFRLSEPVNVLKLRSIEERYPGLRLTSDGMGIEYRPPEVLFPENAEITVDVPPLEDLAGNVIEPFSMQFSTSSQVNIELPYVLDISLGGAVREDVPVNAIIQIQLDSPLGALSYRTLEFSLRESSSNTDLPISIAISDDAKRLFITPENPFEPSTRYRFNIGSLLDYAGMVMRDDQTGLFTTADEEDNSPPSLVDTVIADGQSNVPTNLHVGLLFDERINAGQAAADGSIQLLDAWDNAVALEVTATESEPNLVSFITPALLQPLSDYTLRLGSFDDIGANTLTVNRDIQFTTSEQPDTVAPALQETLPVTGQTEVPTDAELQWRFTEPVQLGTLRDDDIRLLDADGAYVQSFRGQLELVEGGTLIRLLPDETLPANSRFAVDIGIVRDIAGNTWAEPAMLEFQTGAGQGVQNTSR